MNSNRRKICLSLMKRFCSDRSFLGTLVLTIWILFCLDFESDKYVWHPQVSDLLMDDINILQ